MIACDHAQVKAKQVALHALEQQREELRSAQSERPGQAAADGATTEQLVHKLQQVEQEYAREHQALEDLQRQCNRCENAEEEHSLDTQACTHEVYLDCQS